MKKIELSKFQDFIDSTYLKEGIETNNSYWDKYFNNMVSTTQDASARTGESSGLPSWAKKGLDLDALKGKSADQRWDWLTNRVNTVLKDKQVSKIESIKGSQTGDFPGYRLLWKEDKTETGDQTDKSGNVQKVYFTEIFKGNPGTWVDKKDNSGKPGEEISRGYWGQNSRITRAPGATGPTQGVEGGILWVEQPQGSGAGGGTGAQTMFDLFVATDIGREVMAMLTADPNFRNWQDTGEVGEVTYTDSPVTSKEVNSSLTPEQKEAQKANAEKMSQAGQTVEEPKYSEITSGEYSYNPDSFSLTWDKVANALKKAGVDKDLDFKRLNIIGVRNTPYTKNKFSNRFTDLIIVMGPEKTKEVKVYPATTTPGPAFMYIPFRNWWVSAGLQETLNPQGPAILQPGVYDYKVGEYKDKYEALVQAGEVKVGRVAPVGDLKNLTFKTFSPTPIERVTSGIDIIKAETNTPSIDSFSAGSQVLKKSSDFKEMMDAINKANQNSVKYALISSTDFS